MVQKNLLQQIILYKIIYRNQCSCIQLELVNKSHMFQLTSRATNKLLMKMAISNFVLTHQTAKKIRLERGSFSDTQPLVKKKAYFTINDVSSPVTKTLRNHVKSSIQLQLKQDFSFDSLIENEFQSLDEVSMLKKFQLRKANRSSI